MTSKVVRRVLNSSRYLVNTRFVQISRTELEDKELAHHDNLPHFIEQMDKEGDVIKGDYYGCGIYGPTPEEIKAGEIDYHTRKRNRIDIARRISKTDSHYRRKRRYGSRCHKEKREPERQKRRLGIERKYSLN